MAINKGKVFSTLNELIEILKDGEDGFKTAADNVEEPDIRSLFIQYADQRSDYINELQSLVARFGGDAENSGTVEGALHRGWMDLKAAIASKNSEAILNECERGEDIAIKEFSEALQADLPADVKAVISDQFSGIKAVHDNVKRLRDFRKKN